MINEKLVIITKENDIERSYVFVFFRSAAFHMQTQIGYFAF